MVRIDSMALGNACSQMMRVRGSPRIMAALTLGRRMDSIMALRAYREKIAASVVAIVMIGIM